MSSSIACQLASAAQAERARLDVVRERGLADEFGERTADRAAIEIHLEEACLGLRVALQKGSVVVRRRDDGRHAERVVVERAGRRHAGRGDRVRHGDAAESTSGKSKKYRTRKNAPDTRCRHAPSR
ncbi:MAG: hypothetical protein QM741_17390 [Rudaea sp.]